MSINDSGLLFLADTTYEDFPELIDGIEFSPPVSSFSLHYRRLTLLSRLNGQAFRGQYRIRHGSHTSPHLETPLCKIERYHCVGGNLLRSRAQFRWALSKFYKITGKGVAAYMRSTNGAKFVGLPQVFTNPYLRSPNGLLSFWALRFSSFFSAKVISVPRRVKRVSKAKPKLEYLRLPPWAQGNAPLRDMQLHTERVSRYLIRERMLSSLFEGFLKGGGGSVLLHRTRIYTHLLRPDA